MARGSLYELLDHLTVALDDGYVTEPAFNERHSHVLPTVKILNGYIRFFKEQKMNE